MRSNARFRFALLAPLVGVILALVAISAPAAQASFGVASLFASNCQEAATCTKASTESDHAEIFTQAAGHPPQGVTDFTIKSKEISQALPGQFAPEGNVKNIRTDVGPGESTNPEAVKKCPVADFEGTEVEPAPGVHAFTAPSCPESVVGESVIGTNRVTIVIQIPKGEPFEGEYANVELEGKLYNLVQPNGLSAYFGVALNAGPLFKGAPLYFHTFLEGHIEWGKEPQGTNQGDYHDIYEIKNVTPGLIRSRIDFKGNIGTGGFLTLPSSCTGTGPQTTTTLHLESYEGESAEPKFSGPLGTEGCNGASPFEKVPFEPKFGLTPGTGAGETQSDLPDGITAELTVPHAESPTSIDSSQLNTATITLPEGMTLNPSAASGLKSCAPSQIGVKTKNAVTCPEESKLGEVTLTVPDLPASEPLTGDIYLGGPEPLPLGAAVPAGYISGITGPPYTIYLNAESARYGVDVRLEGKVTPNPTTGQVTTTFTENPEQPFSNIKLKFNGGALAPIANPLTCGTAMATTSLVPYIGSFATATPSSSFTATGCASPLPFALTQSAVNQSPGYAGAKTSFTLNIGRGEGQQYLSQVKTVMPAGLVGLLPTVTQCPEPQAGKGECTSASQIGTVSVSAGAGPQPYGFKGSVYLTGPYGSAPFGLSIVVPAIAGPFNLGNVVTRGTINVEPYTARVVATSTLPTIVGGIPLRLRGVSIEINKQGFLQNPTNCGVLATETTLTSTLGVTQTLSTPFQVSECGKLAFKPSFGSAAGARTSKANGASLETTLNVPAGSANVKSVLVQLPRQLPSRLTTLQKACPEAVFATNPYSCPSGSFVGGVRANTPTLAAKLKGPAILVSHGGEAFPDLDLLLEGEGIRVILVGNTNIKNGITTTNFAAPPDVPVSSITVNLPIGGHSALTANGNVCASKLVMPTTIVGQNGTTFKQNTTIKVKNCSVRIAGYKVIGNTAYITVQTYAAGRISGSGSNLATVYRRLGRAEKTATLKVPLSRAGQRRGRPLRVKLRVGFVPKAKSVGNSATSTSVTFR